MTDNQTTSIIAQTAVSRLKNRPAWLTLVKISQETGIPKHWLSGLLCQRSNNPQITRIEQLNRYLDEKGIQ